ncbi:unnamed protein product [Protopolystoma xenopodis]|uniref:Uncharacterized protein n=1 Tax=Protopolystoma xenopodis TaxID=117903 RepID=A0A3S5CB11_9PLAT|nr:unnamed protein product [Protopolystoma xenopodis]
MGTHVHAHAHIHSRIDTLTCFQFAEESRAAPTLSTVDPTGGSLTFHAETCSPRAKTRTRQPAVLTLGYRPTGPRSPRRQGSCSKAAKWRPFGTRRAGRRQVIIFGS